MTYTIGHFQVNDDVVLVKYHLGTPLTRTGKIVKRTDNTLTVELAPNVRVQYRQGDYSLKQTKALGNTYADQYERLVPAVSPEADRVNAYWAAQRQENATHKAVQDWQRNPKSVTEARAAVVALEAWIALQQEV